MIHWLNLFTYLGLSILISLIFLNKSLFSLLLVSEAILLVIFFCGLAIACFYNIYFLLAVSFFVLVLGGLELALNFLIIVFN